jgi:hypothetical protein
MRSKSREFDEAFETNAPEPVPMDAADWVIILASACFVLVGLLALVTIF